MCTYSCRADNSYAQILSFPVQLPGFCFRDSFSDDGDYANLQMATPVLKNIKKITMKWSVDRAYLGKLHGFKSSIISWAKRGKVDHDIGIWMFVHGFGHVFVHCKKKPSDSSMIAKHHKGGLRFLRKFLRKCRSVSFKIRQTWNHDFLMSVVKLLTVISTATKPRR